MNMVEKILTDPMTVTDSIGVKWVTSSEAILPSQPQRLTVFEPQNVTVFDISMSNRKNDKILKKPGERHSTPKTRIKSNGVTIPDFWRHTKNSPTPHAPVGSKKCGN